MNGLNLQDIFYGNTVQAWLTALALALVTLAALRVVRLVLTRRLKEFSRRTKTTLDDLVAELFQKTRVFFLIVLSLWVGSTALILAPVLQGWLNWIAVILVFFQAVSWSGVLVNYMVSHYVELEAGEEPGGAGSTAALAFIGKLALWSVLLLLALENLGVDVTALVASLGVGGIAVALAAQSILGDLFASLSILLDKPFLIGDFVTVGELSGTVERIGLKTTRLRSLWGEQLVFSNADLLNSRIRNFKRMEQRRVVFSIGVVYQTPSDKLKSIPGMIREIIEEHQHVRFDRAHFKNFGDSSLLFEVVYWVLVPDYGTYMNIQQEINIELHRRFEEEQIEFAYPTRTVLLNAPFPAAVKVESVR
ncbi:MAG: mechanosensitive ion channel family protein [Acidobacteriota bacterium]